MNARVVLLMTLLGYASVAVADDQAGWREVVRAFADRDLRQVQRLRSQSLEGLCLDQRNAVGLAAARSLGIADYVDAIGGGSIREHFTKPEAEDSPAEAECRRQWGINMSAAELLRHLAEKRLINDPSVLPYLIQGLDHPDRFWVGQRCFYALAYLTRHRSGDIYWARLVKDDKTHREISLWWQAWWNRNKDRHPIFDAEVEQQARAEILRLATRIDVNVKPHRPELAMFSVPKNLVLRESPLFQVEYNPRFLATFLGPPSVNRDTLPWLCISCRFLSEDLPAVTNSAKRGAPTAPRELRGEERIVYSAVLEGTDVIVEVLAASRDDGLINDLRRALED